MLIMSHNLQALETYHLSLPPHPHDNTCIVCGKVFKSSPRLKRHTKIHKNDIPLVDPINPVQNSSHICHICLKSCKSAAGLKSHLRAHEWELSINQDVLTIVLMVKIIIICQDMTVMYDRLSCPVIFNL